jgi:hypothetical protein
MNVEVRRLAAIGLVVAAACTSVSVQPAPSPLASSPSPSPSGHQGWRTYVDLTNTWEIDLPPEYHAEAVQLATPTPFLSVWGEWLVTGVSRVPSELAAEGRVGVFASRLPAGAALLKISQFSGGGFWLPSGPDSQFPVSVSGIEPPTGGSATAPRLLPATIIADGDRFELQVFLGSSVTSAQRSVISEVLASWRFLPLKPGTFIQRRSQWYILGSTASYAIGSVTRFDATNLPHTGWDFAFYLVRTSEGFYALSWPNNLSGGYKGDCGVTFDPAGRQFICPNGARWAIDGSVVAKPDPSAPEDRLSVPFVRASLDGYVMVTPNASGYDTSVDLAATAPIG